MTPPAAQKYAPGRREGSGARTVRCEAHGSSPKREEEFCTLTFGRGRHREQVDEGGAGRVARQGDAVGVEAEGGRVLAQPVQRRHDVHQAEVTLHAALWTRFQETCCAQNNYTVSYMLRVKYDVPCKYTTIHIFLIFRCFFTHNLLFFMPVNQDSRGTPYS